MAASRSTRAPAPTPLTTNSARAEAWLASVERERLRSPARGYARATRVLARWPRAAPGSAERRALDYRRAQIVRARAHALRGLARYAGAVREYRRAAALFRAGGRGVEAARCVIGEVDALMYLGRYRESRAAGRRALRVLARAGEARVAARLCNNLANIEYRLDRPRTALSLYARARAAFRGAAPADAEARGRIDANRSNCLALQGRPEAAERLLRRARREFTRAGRVLDAAACDYARAQLLFLQHRYAEALFALAELEPSFERLGGEDFRALLDLDASEIYLRLLRPVEASVAAAQGGARAARLGLNAETGKGRYFEGVALAARGLWAPALARLRAAEGAFRREGNRTWLGQCALARAEAELERGARARARRAARLARGHFAHAADPAREGLAWVVLARAESSAGAARVALARARALARRAGTRFLDFRVACLAGDVAFRAAEFAAARRSYRRALALAESVAGRVGDELFRATDWGAWAGAYPRLVELELASGRAGAAFQALERARARAFERVAREEGAPPARRAGALDRASEARLRALACRIEARSFGRSTLAAWPEPPEGAAEQERRLVARLLERLERASIPARAARREALTLRRTGALLDPGSVLFEYFIAHGQVGAFAVDARGHALWSHLLPRSELASLRDELGYLARGAAAGSAGAASDLEARIGDLALRLVAPLYAWARARDGGPGRAAPAEIVIVPAAELAGLPWPSLVGRPVSVIPSVEFLRAPRSRPGGPVVLVGLGSPELLRVEEEIEDLSRLLPGARVLVGREATVARVRSALAGADWLHIAGHGQADVTRPILSGVRLADRWAYLPDLAPNGRAPRVVVLAACHAGELSGGFQNDWQGLPGGLLRAGCDTLVGSLWDADDAATRQFIVAVYARLVEGGSLGEALAGALGRAGLDVGTAWSARSFALFGSTRSRLPLGESASRPARAPRAPRLPTSVVE